MGSAWRGLLSHGEVSRRARADARASDMAQVAKLFDLAFRGSIAHDRLLGWRRALPAGSDEGRTDAVARHPDLWRFADDRMAGLRPALQVEAGGKPHRVDADPVRDPCRDGLGIQPDL